MRKLFLIHRICISDSISFFKYMDMRRFHDCIIRVSVRPASDIQACQNYVSSFASKLISGTHYVNFSRNNADYEILG